jgi:hypothetical protein
VIRRTPHVGCVQMALTVAAVAKNVCMSRRWKADHVGFRTHVQTLACFVPLVALKADWSPVCPVCPEYDQHCYLNSKVCSDQCVRTGHISNQQKAEFIKGIFCIQSFWGGHGEILQKT